MTVLRVLAPAALVLLLASPAYAQRDGDGFLGNIFGRDDRAPQNSPREAPLAAAQLSSSDLVVRLDRLENQIRQLTGSIEQMQYRNQQLEQQIKRMQEDVDFRFQEQAKGGSRPPPPSARSQNIPPPVPPPAPAAQQIPPPPVVSGPAGRRSDAFDPTANPAAPGVPQTIGSTPSSGPPPVISADNDGAAAEAPVGVPGGRRAGAPLDLSTLSADAADDPNLAPRPAPAATPGALPPPPPRNPSATGGQQVVSLPPNIGIKDEYDAAYSSLLRKDYATSEEGFRAFVRKHPTDRLVGEANYWLGESLFQRQRYRDAAEAFLTVSTKFERSGKAPEALLRLGQSLAALNEKDSACATLAEINRKFPKAPVSVKQNVERELKRVRCG